MIMQVRDNLGLLVVEALEALCSAQGLQLDEKIDPGLERPRDTNHGDWASTIALRSAKLLKKNPRQIAEGIVEHLPNNNLVASVEIAGPGFINFTLTNEVMQGVAKQARSEKKDFGKGVIEHKNYINLEYISANPTGPMHVGHGRWAALGDSMARVMRHAGYTVYEEFYINDHGSQMDALGNSVVARYLQALGRDVPMPDNCYGGAYIKDIAQALIERDGDAWLDADEAQRSEAFRDFAYKMMLGIMQETCTSFGNKFDCWFSESSLYVPQENGESAVDHALAAMREKGYIFEKDGAIWFKSTAFDDEKDRVLIKENGEMTYFMSDVAYHYDKLCRGYDHLIDIWGADHHGYIKRCEAMLAAWGRPGDLEIVLGQLVNLKRNGEAVRMSKRTGEMVTFQELLDEVGVDATRYLMLSRSSDQPIDFDIELAKKKDASNPVYYVQYAHARICSMIRKAADPADLELYTQGKLSFDELAEKTVELNADISALTHASELALMRKMSEFADLVQASARDRAPFRFTHYAQELASLFHQFYTNCHVLGEEDPVKRARLYLCDATRHVLALSLDLLGVSAPESM